ncbi:MAG TPA: acyltransferase [Verrucomicrobiae bacterium]|nr:acyltransferase [Verrucomicrobiae bacterium]
MSQPIPPSANASGVNRIGFLEGLRGHLAVWVMLAHVGYFVGLSRFEMESMHPGKIAFFLSYFDLSGYDAVKLFMILSGFVIFYLWDKGREQYGAYLIRRFLRLWPLFMVAVIAGFLVNNLYIDILQNNPWSHDFWIRRQLDGALVVQAHPFPYVLVDAALLNGQVPGAILRDAAVAFSPISWCISTEWHFYLLVPLFYWLTRRPAGVGLLAGLVLTALACESKFTFWINPVHSFLPMQIHWFFTGLVCYLIYRSVLADGLTRGNGWKIGWLALFIILATTLHPREGLGLWLWLPVFYTLIMSALGRRSGLSRLVTAVFDNRVSRYLGQISYSVYLLHWPLAILVARGLMSLSHPPSWGVSELILVVGVTALTLPVAHLTHRYVETPAMNWAKRLAGGFPKRGEGRSLQATVAHAGELAS